MFGKAANSRKQCMSLRGWVLMTVSASIFFLVPWVVWAHEEASHHWEAPLVRAEIIHQTCALICLWIAVTGIARIVSRGRMG